MKRRIELLKHTVLQKKLGGPIKNWLLNCFGPTCPILAKRHIETIEQQDSYKRVKFKNINGFLYFNESLPIHSLYQTIAEQFYPWQWHYYQIPQTTVESSDVVFDCGCAEGIFTFLNHSKAKHIYAFEPLPEYVDGLSKTFSQIKNVSIFNHALGTEKGTAYLEKRGIASFITPQKTDTLVKLDTIDHFCSIENVNPSYIKADLEGYEMNVLGGAFETIRRCKPKIAITTYHVAHHAKEIADFLIRANPSYKILVKGIEERKGAPVMLHAW